MTELNVQKMNLLVTMAVVYLVIKYVIKNLIVKMNQMKIRATAKVHS